MCILAGSGSSADDEILEARILFLRIMGRALAALHPAPEHQDTFLQRPNQKPSFRKNQILEQDIEDGPNRIENPASSELQEHHGAKLIEVCRERVVQKYELK